MALSMTEIFKVISEQKTVEERSNALLQAARQVATVPMMLQIAFDKNCQFELPPGAPPYKPCEQLDQHGRLHQEMRRMYIFLKGGPEMPQLRRETIFVQILESIEPEDAELLIACKDKKFPYKNITRKMIETTLPGLLTDKENEQK